MSDYDFPDLPSDEDLGITEEDRKAFEEEGGDGPEMTDAELEALLGERPSPPPPPKSGASAAAGGAAASAAGARKAESAADGKAARASAKEAEKAAKKAARKAARAEKKAAKAAKKAAGAAPKTGDGTATDSGGASSPPTDGPAGADARRPTSTALAGPRTRWRAAVTLLFLVATAWFSSADRYTPRPVPANAPEDVFSSARAMATLIEVARAPHPTGSPEHARVRQLIVDHLVDLGLQPEIQTGLASVQANGRARLVTARNIVARIPGTDPTGAFLITAHYDARDQSLGASDDGAGVVAILEALRAALHDGDFRNDVIVLITDAEELGLMGARVFADEHEWIDDVRVAVSLEMRGSAGPAIMFETKDENGWIVRQLAEADSHAYANSMSFEVYRRMPNATDFTILREAGIQGLNFAAIDGAPAYHQRYDDPAHLSEATLQHHGEHALSTLRHFGNVDLSVVDAPNAVYTTLPFVGMIVYDKVVGYALSTLVVLFFGLAFLTAQRKGARIPRIGAGALLSIAVAAASGGLGLLLLHFIPQFHGEYAGLQGSAVHGEGWYVLALVVGAATLVWTTGIVARRWLTLSELALGAAVLPTLAAVVSGFAMPLVAVNLHWPVLALTVAVTLSSLAGDRLGGRISWGVGLIGASVVLLFLTPILQILWLAMSIRLALVLGAFAAIIVQLCLPVLDALRHPSDWMTPFAGIGATAALVAVGLLSAGTSPERPAPSTLSYAYEHGTGDAFWLTEPTDHPEDQIANDWVESKVGAFDSRMDFTSFGYVAAQAATAKADAPDAERPEILTLRNDVNGRTRVVDLAIRSRIGAEVMQFRYGDRGTTRLLSVDGVPVEDPAGLQGLEHWGVPEREYLVLELEAPEGDPIDLYVTEHLLRPGEVLDPAYFERPPELSPNPNWLSDRALLKTSIADFGDPSFAIVPVDEIPEGVVQRLRGEEGDGTEPQDSALPPVEAESNPPVDSVDVTTAGDTLAADTLARDTAAIDTVATDAVAIDTIIAQRR